MFCFSRHLVHLRYTRAIGYYLADAFLHYSLFLPVPMSVNINGSVLLSFFHRSYRLPISLNQLKRIIMYHRQCLPARTDVEVMSYGQTRSPRCSELRACQTNIRDGCSRRRGHLRKDVVIFSTNFSTMNRPRFRCTDCLRPISRETKITSQNAGRDHRLRGSPNFYRFHGNLRFSKPEKLFNG